MKSLFSWLSKHSSKAVLHINLFQRGDILSFLSDLSNITVVWGFIFGPSHFIKKLRTQNLSKNAGESLKLAQKLKSKLHNLLGKARSREIDRLELIPKLEDLLSDFYESLKLLKHKLPNSLQSWSKKALDTIRLSDHSEILAFFEKETIYDEQGRKVPEKLDLLSKKLEIIHTKPKEKYLDYAHLIVILLFTCIYHYYGFEVINLYKYVWSLVVALIT